MSNAQDAFLRGDFEACLALCDAIVVRDAGMRFDVVLTRARALMRLGHADQAIGAFEACAFTPATTDALVSAKMLLAAAHARVGGHQRSEELFRDAEPHLAQAHPTIQAEFALHQGMARYWAGEADEADRLLSSVPSDMDMISARALEYRGWIAFTRGTLDAATLLFRAAFTAIRECRWHDRFVEATVLRALATLSSEMLTTDGWAEIEARIRGFDWDLDGLAMPRFWVATCCSTMSELIGNDGAALAWSREAEARAEDDSYRAMALCRTAAVFRGLGERRAHLEFVSRACAAYARTDPRTLDPSHRELALFIAEECAYAGVVVEARRLAAHYRNVMAAVIPAGTASDKRVAALAQAVEGCIAEASGERIAAIQLYTKAFRVLRTGPSRLRAVAVALRLARLTGSRRYVQYAHDALADAHPDFWMAREARTLQSVDAPALTDHQRTILLLVAQGKTYKEIASTLGRSWKTISNSVEHLRGKFGAGSRGELVAHALRHGVVDVGESETVRTA